MKETYFITWCCKDKVVISRKIKLEFACSCICQWTKACCFCSIIHCQWNIYKQIHLNALRIQIYDLDVVCIVLFDGIRHFVVIKSYLVIKCYKSLIQSKNLNSRKKYEKLYHVISIDHISSNPSNYNDHYYYLQQNKTWIKTIKCSISINKGIKLFN